MERAAVRRECASCARPVMVGLDADCMALPAQVDRIPLSRLGECYARRAGLWTYTLHVTKTRTEIDYRDTDEYWPRFGIVVPQHLCTRKLKIDRRLRA